jgi:RNA polymerase sigma-54 factor
MRLDASQNLRLEQQMKLSPRIIQAMEILQLPMQALLERIDAEMQTNPVLELKEGGGESADQGPEEPDDSRERGEEMMVVEDNESNSDDFERLAEFTDEYGMEPFTSDEPYRPPAKPSGERDRKMDAMANTPAPSQSLSEYLLEQWTFVEAPEELKPAGEKIIEHIDAKGYLRTELAELAEPDSASYRLEQLREALGYVQTLEPPGVGARDPRECLLIQLQQEAQTGRDVCLEMQLVQRHLRDIEMNRLPQIARRTGKDIEEVKQALENLSRLTPYPGLLVGDRAAPAINPDILVELDEDGQIVVTMADGNDPQLMISRTYRRMVRDRRADRDARKFVQKNIRSAKWLISAIQQRRQTVRRVAEEVFQVQREFLESGTESLKPLPMVDVANKVGVHVATVSRAVAGKYVQTPLGIYPLRMFFSGGTKTAQGQDVSWDAVKAKLKETIDAEDKSKPLNDDQLAKSMQEQGIDIARRTVAKYRNLMDIPPARKRKEY